MITIAHKYILTWFDLWNFYFNLAWSLSSGFLNLTNPGWFVGLCVSGKSKRPSEFCQDRILSAQSLESVKCR